LIAERWSPEQISGILKLHGPFTISHETIYKRIIHNKKEGGQLYKDLRIMPKASHYEVTAPNAVS
jgi:IS30 family transposase